MKINRKLVCNQASEARFVQVINQVNTASIRRETAANGDELIIIPSYTLPDDVVMNGGLYPKHEIEASYKSLEGTPAPIGHPIDSEGNFASARSMTGIDNFHAGVWNTNVQRKDNRIYVEKAINARVAMQSEIGKRLMERVNNLLDGKEVDPIHTSVCVFLNAEDKAGMINNQEYSWIAKDMEFDHDAILLDEQGAATPKEGVGMMVNKDKKLIVNRFVCDEQGQEITPEQVITAINNDKKGIWTTLKDAVLNALTGNSEENNIGQDGRDSNHTTGEIMNREQMIKLLKANGATVADDATDEQLTEQLTNMLSANRADSQDKAEDESGSDIAQVIANAIAPLTAKLEGLEAKANAKEEADKASLIEALKDEFEADELKTMSVNTLQKLVDKQKPAFQFNSHFQPNSKDGLNSLEMPNLEVK